ncbi:hypothetical protein AGMMS50249_1160 [candidate division SR1 bacterium]|nr:hypothetical protein AGMMS50249_1160 [candidate division SR1 bacterium]
MPRLFSFLMSLIFIAFFYAINLWYFGIFPLAFIIFLLTRYSKDVFSSNSFKPDWYQYSLIGVWFLIMIGLSGILFFIGIDEITVYLSLLILNIFLFLVSYIIPYQDGKRLFEIGICIISFILLGTITVKLGFYALRNGFSLLSFLFTGVLVFLTNIVGIFFPVPKKYRYLLLVAGMVSLICGVMYLIHPFQISLFVSFLIITVAYFVIRQIKSRKIPKPEPSSISVRRILSGERIHKKLIFPKRKLILHERLVSSPHWLQKALELPNLLLLTANIILYISAIMHAQVSEIMFWYWINLAVFLANTFILKKAQFISNITRFAIALVINFALYSALLTTGYENISNILPFLILRTVICQIALFYINRLKTRFLFTKNDYLYWTVVTCGATAVNIILMFQIQLPTQFLFFLTFLYLGIELLILYYVFLTLSSSFGEESSNP